MSRIFFTADSHFGHVGILAPRMHAPRPFATIEEHDETLISRWNGAVGLDDTVWHLGDFAYRCREEHAAAIFARLNGRKFLVRGNHEKLGAQLPWDAAVVDVTRIHVPLLEGGSQGIWLSHYAHRTWPHLHRGDIHLYGHSHGSLPGNGASTDVGVDCWDWRPVTFDEIRERIAGASDLSRVPDAAGTF